jgi:hypothetical protein
VVVGSSPTPRIMNMLTWREKLGRPDCPYLIRWVLNLGLFSVRLHHWLGSDDPRAHHDHPWWYLTLVLWGGYVDSFPGGSDKLGMGSMRFRRSSWIHTVKVNPGGCWTLMLTGPEVRDWGFWVGGKFVRRNKYFFRHGVHECHQ